MKEFFASLFSVIICFSLVACGESNIETTPSNIGATKNTESEISNTDNNSETSETENVFHQESGNNTNELTEAETDSQQGITEDDIVGTWMCELPYKQGGMGTPAFQMDLYKGGTGKGYEKRNDKIDMSKCYVMKWEIKDDVIVISYTYDPLSWTFEMSEDKTRIIEVTSENSFVKNN